MYQNEIRMCMAYSARGSHWFLLLNMHIYYVVIADSYFGSTLPLDFVTCQLRMPVMELI